MEHLQSEEPFSSDPYFSNKMNVFQGNDYILLIEIQYNLDLRNCDFRKNLDLKKIVPTSKILVYKLFDLIKIV